MNITLPTPQGAILLNLTKVNAVDLRDNLIVVLFTSEKCSNLSYEYENKSKANDAFKFFTHAIEVTKL